MSALQTVPCLLSSNRLRSGTYQDQSQQHTRASLLLHEDHTSRRHSSHTLHHYRCPYDCRSLIRSLFDAGSVAISAVVDVPVIGRAVNCRRIILIIGNLRSNPVMIGLFRRHRIEIAQSGGNFCSATQIEIFGLLFRQSRPSHVEGIFLIRFKGCTICAIVNIQTFCRAGSCSRGSAVHRFACIQFDELCSVLPPKTSLPQVSQSVPCWQFA